LIDLKLFDNYTPHYGNEIKVGGLLDSADGRLDGLSVNENLMLCLKLLQ